MYSFAETCILGELKSLLYQELERLQKEKDRLDRREKEQRGEIDRYVAHCCSLSLTVANCIQ
jgi:hypothetical protein